jgi:hypothetical protein
MPAFDRYIGIDYSGAETPIASLKGLRIYMADRGSPPVEVPPPPRPRKYWTRRGIAEWLVERVSEQPPTLVGIDHGFSFPLRYFEVHGLPPDWSVFLDDCQRQWPTDDDHTYVDFVRFGVVGNGAARTGNARWARAGWRLPSVGHRQGVANRTQLSETRPSCLRDLRRYTAHRETCRLGSNRQMLLAALKCMAGVIRTHNAHRYARDVRAFSQPMRLRKPVFARCCRRLARRLGQLRRPLRS